MAHQTYPSLPASPTLTNPDMILPYGDYDSDPEPSHNAYRPLSPEDEWTPAKQSDMQYSLGSSAHMSSAESTPIIYGNGTMLSDIGEVTEAESVVGRKLPRPAERRLLRQPINATPHANVPFGSSPTIGYNTATKRMKAGTHERKVSMESTSTVTSEGQAAELFRDFDDGVSVDDSVFQGDDEESVADSYSEQVFRSETERLARSELSLDRRDDQNSSAALSKRAEDILLNAKMRLNNMEGNLTRARSTLYANPSSSLPSLHSSSPLTKSTPSPPNDRRAKPKHQLHITSDSPAASPGHSRGYSENSIAEPVQNALFPARSASAAARYDRIGADGSKKSPTLNGGFDKKPHSPRERGFHLQALSEDELAEFDGDQISARSSSEDGGTSSNGEHRGLTRSASSLQMRDLRDQMQDLKGRLSALRDRARDDHMKRRSMQSLRTPSPFTAAEQWYNGAPSYLAPDLNAEAGSAQHPPIENEREDQSVSEEFDLDEGISQYDRSKKLSVDESDYTNSYEDADENFAEEEMESLMEHQSARNVEDTRGLEMDDEAVTDEDETNMEQDPHLDEYESDTSMYHDTLQTPLSHEDREDAFDYEHFFLHSAMGTLSRQRNERRDSVNSEDSVETTRGPYIAASRASLGHSRVGSTDSVSTIATFATATEGHGSEHGKEEEDAYSDRRTNGTSQQSPRSPPVKASESARGTKAQVAHFEEGLQRRSGISTRNTNGSQSGNPHRPSIASIESFGSSGTTRSFPLINKPKTHVSSASKGSFSSRSSPHSASPTLVDWQINQLQQPPINMLAKDDQKLVEAVVASLGKCVLGLQESKGLGHEGKVWRRRLETARKLLDGEDVS